MMVSSHFLQRTMTISSCTLALLLSNSLASSTASPWMSPQRRRHHEAFVPHGVISRYETALLSGASEVNGGKDLILIDDTNSPPCDPERSIKAHPVFPHKIRSNMPSKRLMEKVPTAAAVITALSTSLPFSAIAATNQAHETMQASTLESSMITSAFESSSIYLSFGEVAAGLQFLYTAILVTGVGYTQRMAGREDFKKDMAMKIANGEITPEELVEEIRLMAEEINQSADVAYSAQMEVQKLLAETRAIATNTLQLPSSTTSSLPKIDFETEVEEKVYVPAFETQFERENEMPSAAIVEREEEIPYFFQTAEVEETLVANSELETSLDERIEAIVPEAENEYTEFIEIESEADLIADALLAPPPSLRSKSVAAEGVVGIIEDSAMGEHVNGNSPSLESVDKSDSKEDERKWLEEKRESIRQQAEAIRSSFKSSSSGGNLDQDVSNAYKLAEEALANASMNGSMHSDEESTAILEVEGDVSKIPTPPDSPPPLDLVMESANAEPEVEDAASKQRAKPVEKGPVRSSPLARVLAVEYGVRIEDIFPGTGMKGRVVADDVRKYVAELTTV
ncbi:hypothetical protein ACHAXS_011010 [Conticribra weissflogii]